MENLNTLLAQMEVPRRRFEGTLQLIFDLCLPDDESIIATRTPGGRRRYALYASTAGRAAKKFANFIHAVMLPEAGMWGSQRPLDRNLHDDKQTMQWFYDANTQISTALSASNFYQSSYEVLLDYGIAGIGVLHAQTNMKVADQNGSRFKSFSFYAVPISNFFYLAATADDLDRRIKMGDPNRIARVMEMEKFEIEEKFDAAGSDLLKNGKDTDLYRCVHIVTPNHASSGGSNLWNSTYALLGKSDDVRHLSASKEPEILSTGFLPRMPYFTPRMSQVSGEIWPRGFGMDVLQDILEENVLTKHMLNSIGKDADPPTIVGHEAAMHLELIAGGVSYMDPDRFDQIKQLRSESRYDAVFARIDKLEKTIEAGFLVDQLQLAQLDRATATEVVKREEDQTRLLSSTFTKAERELPAKVHDFCFEEMLELGAFGETPEALADGAETQVIFDSPLANARRRRQLDPMRRYVTEKIALSQNLQDPSVLDRIDFDQIDKLEQEIEGFDPRIFRSDKDVAAIRQGRADAAARAEAREGAKVLPAVASAAKTAEEAGVLQ